MKQHPDLRAMNKCQTISIAMATCNGEKYLHEQLNSFVYQTRPPDEVVVFDDHSEDQTVNILREFQSKNPFPVWIGENTCRVGVNRNFERAIDHCSSDIIALSDQDDVWHPEKLQRLMYEFARSDDLDAIFSDAEVVDDSLHPMGYRLSQQSRMTGKTKTKCLNGQLFALLTTRGLFAGMTMAFRAQWKQLIKPIPDYMDCNHDLWIGLLIAAAGSMRYLDEPLVYYRQHDLNFIGAVSGRRGPAKSQPSKDEKMKLKLERDIRRVQLNREVCFRLKGQAISAVRQREWRIADKRVRHLESRIAIRQCPFGFRRLVLILRELLTLRYLYHSTPKSTRFIKDLFWSSKNE